MAGFRRKVFTSLENFLRPQAYRSFPGRIDGASPNGSRLVPGLVLNIGINVETGGKE